MIPKGEFDIKNDSLKGNINEERYLMGNMNDR